MAQQDKSRFEQVYMIDCSEFIERKKTDGGKTQLSYLSWANAWAKFKVAYPDATYEVKKNDRGLPFFADGGLGIMVYTSITAEGQTHEMWLPVMDGANKAMKSESYTYKVKDYKTGGYVDKAVKGADMFDVNKTIMRCLTKNMAMFGLGLSIYSGEDIPQPLTRDEEEAIIEEVKERKARKPQPQRVVETKEEEPQPQEPIRVTMDMYLKGRCKNIINYLVNGYDRDKGDIQPGALQEVKSRYRWDEDALDAVWEEARKIAFSNDINTAN